jgi:hypothetical protein
MNTPRMKEAWESSSRTADGFYSTAIPMRVHAKSCYEEGCKLERELATITEQRDRLAEIVIRIGWPARGTADDFATVSDFATEIQATWKYEELKALQSLTLKP